MLMKVVIAVPAILRNAAKCGKTQQPKRTATGLWKESYGPENDVKKRKKLFAMPAVDADVDIQAWPEVPSIAHFCSLFR